MLQAVSPTYRCFLIFAFLSLIFPASPSNLCSISSSSLFIHVIHQDSYTRFLVWQSWDRFLPVFSFVLQSKQPFLPQSRPVHGLDFVSRYNMSQFGKKRHVAGRESSYFYKLGAHAKFWNPPTTPSGILVTVSKKDEED